MKSKIVYLDISKIYKFEGILFEDHDVFGNIPVNKKHNPISRLPRGFWKSMEKFNKLTDKQKIKYRIA